MSDFIEIKKLGKTYQSTSFMSKQHAKQVLTNINISIQQGESVALVGASGSGKSTLCRLMLGIESPTSGDILWRGQSFNHFDRSTWREYRQSMQLVFQDSISAVNPRQTVLQILSEPMKYLRQLDKQQRRKEAAELIDRIGLPKSCLTRKAGQLSGGQLQRICIARALAAKPKMIALDESLSSLDLVLQQQIIALLKSIQNELGMTFLLVTHDLRLVDIFCDRVIVLDQGKIVESRYTSNGEDWKSEMGTLLHKSILPARPQSLSEENERVA